MSQYQINVVKRHPAYLNRRKAAISTTKPKIPKTKKVDQQIKHQFNEPRALEHHTTHIDQNQQRFNQISQTNEAE